MRGVRPVVRFQRWQWSIGAYQSFYQLPRVVPPSRRRQAVRLFLRSAAAFFSTGVRRLCSTKLPMAAAKLVAARRAAPQMTLGNG